MKEGWRHEPKYALKYQNKIIFQLVVPTRSSNCVCNRLQSINVWYSYVCAFSVFGLRIPSKGCSPLFSSAIRYVVGRWPKPHSPFGLRVPIDMKSHQSHLTSLSNGYVMKANEIVEKKEIRLVSEFVWRCMRYWSLMLRFWIITTRTRSSRMNQVDFCDGKRKYAIVTTIYMVSKFAGRRSGSTVH